MTSPWWPADRRTFLGHWHVNNDTDCRHELTAVDMVTAVEAIRLHQAQGLAEVSGAVDLPDAELPGTPHYLEGHRRAGMTLVVDWLRSRV